MRLIGSYGPPKLHDLGLDLTLTGPEEEMRRYLKAYADDRLQPTCARLDRLQATEVVQKGSEWWLLLQNFYDLGIDVDSIYLGPDKVNGNRLKSIAFEELGRGDSGFATGLMVAFFPYVMAKLLRRDDLAELAKGKIGCWIATQPSRGSDAGDVNGSILHPGGRHEQPELFAEDCGSFFRLRGRSSEWVSLGPVAEVALAYVPVSVGGEFQYRSDGTLASIGLMVPLEGVGVSRGEPLEKIGQRALPQGAIYFNDVEVKKDYVIADRENYEASFTASLIEGNQTLGAVFTGLGRCCLEAASEYTHQRRQGGTMLTNHQLVRHRMFENFQRVQAMRAVMRQTLDYNARAEEPELVASVTSKTFVTTSAVEIASDCMRLFGAKGLMQGSPVEKLLRDARASLTEDGDNHILGLIAGSHLSQAWQASLDSLCSNDGCDTARFDRSLLSVRS